MSGTQTKTLVVGVVALVVVGGVMFVGFGNDVQLIGDTDRDSQASGSPVAESNAATDAASNVEVKDVGSSASIDENGSLNPSITLVNDGTGDIQQTVEVKIDGDDDGELDSTVALREVTVPAGETRQLTFTIAAPAPGEYRYAVVTDGDVRTDWSVEVRQSPTFVVDGTSVDGATIRGESATVSMQLVNEGGSGAERTVALRVAGQAVAERTVSIGAGQERTLSMGVPTTDLDPGAHRYTVSIANDTATGELEVLRPVTVTVDDLGGELDVTRGTNATVNATVTNAGDVAGNETVALRGLGEGEYARTVSLAPNESTVVAFTVPTDDLSAGTYAYSVASESDELAATEGEGNGTSTTLEVRDGYFQVSHIGGNDTVLVGQPMTFAATVTNVGDATESQRIEVGIDLADGPTPEMLGIRKNVTLEPGESKRVRFRIPATTDTGTLPALDELKIGSYIYGIYSEDTNRTSVFDARPDVTLQTPIEEESSDDESSDDETTSTTTNESVFADRDEISQAKYGVYYERLSGETRAQIDEVYERQPFAAGLGITDVLTREEIARQKYGLDVRIGDEFEFDEIDLDLQQRIEADFDAQFTSQSGDRIESLDELSQQEYGTTYDQLTEAQQERILSLYRQQFD